MYTYIEATFEPSFHRCRILLRAAAAHTSDLLIISDPLEPIFLFSFIVTIMSKLPGAHILSRTLQAAVPTAHGLRHTNDGKFDLPADCSRITHAHTF